MAGPNLAPTTNGSNIPTINANSGGFTSAAAIVLTPDTNNGRLIQFWTGTGAPGTALTNVGNFTTAGASVLGSLDITGTNSAAVLGAELITNAADRDFSSDTGNWTGTGWTIGAGVITHTAGANVLTLNNAALSSPAASGNLYQISFTNVTSVAGTLVATLGGVNGTIVGQGVITNTQVQVVTAATSGALTFTPDANWVGTIDNVSVKQITPSVAVQRLINSNGVLGVEIRSGGATAPNANTFIGVNVGKSDVSGENNTGSGFNALSSNVSGGGNSAYGFNALSKNSVASNNSAFGLGSLQMNTTGAGNSAFGLLSLALNTSGGSNVSIGVQSMQQNATGGSNSAFGTGSLSGNVSGSNNVAAGISSGSGSVSGSRNIFLGPATIAASQNQVTTGSKNISIGNDVAVASATADNQLVIGNLIYGTTLNNTGATISTGSIGIGVKAPAQKLEVAGTIRQAGCVTAGTLSANVSGDIICTPSSRRFKRNISSDTPGLDAIVDLLPVSFQYRAGMNLGARPHVGFLAEQAASVAPEFASYDAKGKPYGLDTSAILAAAVKALQQQQIMIETLAQRVRMLESAANDAAYRRTAFQQRK
jgi:hypothetical protein